MPTGWQVWYEDGSTYSSARGDKWRTLPTTGVVCVHLQWDDGRYVQLLGAPFSFPGDPKVLDGPGMEASTRHYKELMKSRDF